MNILVFLKYLEVQVRAKEVIGLRPQEALTRSSALKGLHTTLNLHGNASVPGCDIGIERQNTVEIQGIFGQSCTGTLRYSWGIHITYTI